MASDTDVEAGLARRLHGIRDMPSHRAIVQSLAFAANEFVAVSVAWHIALLVALLAVLAGRMRLTQRAVAALLVAPALSVALVAWAVGNLFNAFAFASLCIGLLWLASRLPARTRAEHGPRWALSLGVATVAYAVIYPHFVVVESAWQYAFLAPLGVLPCPTLSLMVGVTLIAGGLSARAWSLTVGVIALAYALVGVIALDTALDLGLLIAAAGLLLLVRAVRSASSQDASERGRIDAFLRQSRVALVGASSDPKHFSRFIMSELIAHGIEVVPVHSHAAEIAGCRAFAHVGEVDPPVQAALIMTPSAQSSAVVEACADAGIQHVWLHRGAGPGAVSEEAVRVATRRGLVLVAGRCPLMFLGAGELSIHGLHASLLRLTGRYPERARGAG